MKYLPLILISAGCIFAFITRIVIPWSHVFTPSGIILNTPDAYIMVRYSEYFPNYPVWDWYRSYPVGQPGFPHIIFPSLVALFSYLTGGVWTAAAWIPVVLFYVSLIPIYLIAKALFDNQVAAGSVLLYCLMPGEILERTMLGAADYHCLEILLFTVFMCYIILAIKSTTWGLRATYIMGALSAWVLYRLAWGQGALIGLFIVGCFLWSLAFWRIKGWHLKLYLVLVSLIGASAITYFFRVEFGSFVKLISIKLTTSCTEMMPLLFTLGQFDYFTTIWNYFGFTFFLTLVSLGWFAYRTLRDKQAADILFLCWSIIMLWLMICMRRFAYYFALNAAILTAGMALSAGRVSFGYLLLWASKNASKERIVKYSILVILLVCAPLMINSIRLSASNTYSVSQDWQAVGNWFREQSPNHAVCNALYKNNLNPPYGVLTTWDNGYWLTAVGHQAVYGDPGHWITMPAEVFMLGDIEKARERIKDLKVKYIILDREMLYSGFDLLVLQSGYDNVVKEKTFIYWLYDKQPIYQVGDVKVFDIGRDL